MEAAGEGIAAEENLEIHLVQGHRGRLEIAVVEDDLPAFDAHLEGGGGRGELALLLLAVERIEHRGVALAGRLVEVGDEKLEAVPPAVDREVHVRQRDRPGAVDVATLAPAPRTVVVFGAEAAGVSPAILRLADTIARIPMSTLGGALADDPPSLNVAVASAVMLDRLSAR